MIDLNILVTVVAKFKLKFVTEQEVLEFFKVAQEKQTICKSKHTTKYLAANCRHNISFAYFASFVHVQR